MILDLSVELLGEIGSKLIQKDRANLRAVCKVIGGAVEHLFFSSLVLTTQKVRTGAGLELLTAIARGETGWSAYTHTLCICIAFAGLDGSTEQALEFDVSEARIQALQAALGALRNIRTVEWEIKQTNPEWERMTICTLLNALHGLDELRLVIHGMVDLSLPVLSGVKKVKIENRVPRHLGPGWLPGHGGEPAAPPILQEISRRITSKLTTLHLDGSMRWAKLWTVLGAGGIHLTEITTSVITPAFFTYLASYAGLQRLTLIPDDGSRDASDQLADAFYETALVPHTSSLLALSCPAVYESRWSFGSHNAARFTVLRALTALEVSVNAGDLKTIQPPEEDRLEWVNGALIIHIGQQVEADQDEIDTIVTDLLTTVATLPVLRNLVILAAETERNRGAWCGNGRINHITAVNIAIESAIQNFISEVPCPPVVQAGIHTYRLRRVPVEHFINIWGEKVGIRGEKFKETFVYQQTGLVSSWY
ncbi:hypothetical protein DFH06DRAFT_1246716 [Mycena polygramma]|nr:hypothetical protein DFH06DRAFT_1246716 [Mycena polygramma]